MSVIEELKTLPVLIDGSWTVEEGEAEPIRISSPATGEALHQVAPAGAETVERAVTAARRAQPGWERLTVFERAKLCHRVADLLDARREELAAALTLEQGKTLHESRAEVDEGAENWRLAAEDAKRLRTEMIPVADPTKRVLTMRKANGVYAVLLPWNFPLLMPCELLAPMVAVGNTLVMKPSELTAATSNLLFEIFAEADFPAGVFNIVHGAGATGAALVESDVDAIAFVGSHETGLWILNHAGYRRTLIEASGNGPVIVCADADLERAALGAVAGAFTCAGQICCATERVIVERPVHDDFVAAVVEQAAGWPLGDPFAATTKVGPLNNQATAEKMDRHLADARERGAEILVGGGRADGFPTDLYYEPTVVDRVGLDTLLHREESFGPVVPVIAADDAEDALRIANDTDLGLQVSVYTENLKTAFGFAENLRAGNVIVNDATTWWEPMVPFGGAAGTKSGQGRYDGHLALLEMTDLRTIAIGI